MGRNTYTPEQKALAQSLYEEGMGPADISRQFENEHDWKIPKTTIASWTSRAGLATIATEKRKNLAEGLKATNELKRQQRLEGLIDKLDDRIDWLIDRMDTESTEVVIDQKGGEHIVTQKPRSADVKNFGTTAAIFIDKRQLLTGGATANTVNQNLNVLVEAPNLKALIAGKEAENEAKKNALVVQAREVTE